MAFRAGLADEWSDDYRRGGYQKRYTTELADSPQRRHESRVRLDWMRRWTDACELLEIGCADGYFLAEAQARGYQVNGVEASPIWAASARAKLGPVVLEGLVEELDLGDASFDAVCLWHVLEHAPDPLAVLERARHCLRNGGLAFLEVPNADSAGARRMGASWPHLSYEDHALFFSPNALRETISRAGLQPVQLTTTLSWDYLPWRTRARPRKLAVRGHRAVIGKTWRTEHPTRGDLLRAVARRP